MKQHEDLLDIDFISEIQPLVAVTGHDVTYSLKTNSLQKYHQPLHFVSVLIEGAPYRAKCLPKSRDLFKRDTAHLGNLRNTQGQLVSRSLTLPAASP